MDYKNNPQEYPNCVSGGKYCIDPNIELGVSDGRQFIYENIRQKCVYMNSQSQNLYLKYMAKFYDECISKNLGFDGVCANSTLDSLNIKDKIESCIRNSFGNSSNYLTSKNVLLDKELEDKNLRELTIFFPGILINNRFFRGSWNIKNLIEAICGNLIEKPNICYVKGGFEKQTEDKSGLSWGSYFLIILLIILVNLILFYICKFYMSKKIDETISSSEMDSRINSVVSTYLSLKEPK